MYTRLILTEVKIHVILTALKDAVVSDLGERYGAELIEEYEQDELIVDPGGMIMAGDNYIVKDFNEHGIVKIKPELVPMAKLTWSNSFRHMDDGLTKVYIDNYTCLVIPSDLYEKIGGWLASDEVSGAGYSARMEIYERLSDHPNVYIQPPTPINEEDN